MITTFDTSTQPEVKSSIKAVTIAATDTVHEASNADLSDIEKVEVRNVHEEVKPTKVDVETESSTSDAAPIFTLLQINESNISMCVDTGCTFTIIGLNKAKSLGLSFISIGKKKVAFADRKAEIDFRTADVRVSLFNQTRHLRIFIVKDMPVPLLGLNWLMAFNASINLTEMKLQNGRKFVPLTYDTRQPRLLRFILFCHEDVSTLKASNQVAKSWCEEALPKKYKLCNKKRIDVRLLEDVVIPAGKQLACAVSLHPPPTDGTLVQLTGHMPTMVAQQLLLSKATVLPEKPVVLIGSVGKRDVSLKKGKVIAFGEVFNGTIRNFTMSIDEKSKKPVIDGWNDEFIGLT